MTQPRLTVTSPPMTSAWQHALVTHWREYLMEGAGLGMFMISACLFVALIEHPASAARQGLEDPFVRRTLIGIAMGLTAIALIYSPWGKRSGAHLNPAVSFTFWRLGKIEGWDAMFYMLAHFSGAFLGVLLSSLLLPAGTISDASVNYVVTVPGGPGPLVALVCETAISFGMMFMVLQVSNQPSLNRHTGIFAGALVAVYITLEAPLSGMSMNPARTLGSALPALQFDSLWLYFAGPYLGMLLAAECYVRTRGERSVLCCKLHHDNAQPCIFRCSYPH
jgi:aquaporin Z